tara:strand:- start:106 stop:396 length:291 start_codon:yes stop_codon:yes gene_type:complete
MKTVGDIIKQWRLKNKMSSTLFLQKMKEAGESISGGYLTFIELHGATPSPPLINTIAKVIQVDVKELIKIVIEQKINRYRASVTAYYEKKFFKFIE